MHFLGLSQQIKYCGDGCCLLVLVLSCLEAKTAIFHWPQTVFVYISHHESSLKGVNHPTVLKRMMHFLHMSVAVYLHNHPVIIWTILYQHLPD